MAVALVQGGDRFLVNVYLSMPHSC